MNEEDDFTEEQIAQGRRFVMHWRDFSESVSTLPDYELKVRNLIRLRLGYLPPTEMVYIPYEPYLRTLFAQYDEGKLNGDVFLDEADTIVRSIRNDDLKKHGFVSTGAFTKQDYQLYESELPVHKEAARRRLSCILGYEPRIEHSLYAEIHMRQLMQEEYYHEEMLLDKVDHRSFTIYHYNLQEITDGNLAAASSPLVRIGE